MITNANLFEVPQDTGYIKVLNRGVYFAFFNLIYYVNGSFNNINSYQLAVLQKDIILIPHNAKNIHVSIYYAIQFSTWFILYNKYFSSPPKKCFTLYGTVFNPSCQEVPCHNKLLNNYIYCPINKF